MESAKAVHPSHLLLLPPSPWPLTHENLAAAYDKPLTSTLKGLNSSLQHKSVGVTLDIAVPLPFLHDNNGKHKSALYSTVQTLVAGLYRRCCVIATKESINVEDAEGVDIRVLLLSQPRKVETRASTSADLPVNDNVLGPVVDVHALARCHRHWDSIYSVESEECESILKQLSIIMEARLKIQRVPGGVVQVNEQESSLPDDDSEAQAHYSLAIGGTWDHLHIGHKLLLTMFAFLADTSNPQQACSLTIGTTGDELLKNKSNPELLQTWHERCKACSDFLLAIMDFRPSDDGTIKREEHNDPGPNGHAVHITVTNNLTLKLVEITDPYGPTITDESISALVVSAETRSGGKAVNDKRSEKEWPQLQVFEVEVLEYDEDRKDGHAEDDFKSKISSTGIRQSLANKGRMRSKA